MNFFYLASLIIFCLTVGHAIKRQKKKTKTSEQSFWSRERQSNAVRRKPLDSLNYIHIPLEQLPATVLTENDQVAECLRLITELSSQKIVNLTGFTNTELKLEYGTANITLLSEYDQNYTLLVRTLQQWADALMDAGYVKEAEAVMAFALDTGTDISKTYYKLAEIYSARGDSFQIGQLMDKARSLRSANRKAIVRTLQEAYPSAGSPHSV